MNIRKIREDLGRVKACCHRRDFQYALFLMISSLKELGGQRAPTDLRTDYREALTDICGDPDFKALHPQPLSYQAGKEREILSDLVQLYQRLAAHRQAESYDVAAARKLKIDHALRDGRTYLAKGQIPEADVSFMTAVQNYRDENALFLMIAKAYMNIKEYTRALGYLREGIKRAPQDPALRELADTCQNLREKSGR